MSQLVEKYRDYLGQPHAHGSIINKNLLITVMAERSATWLNYRSPEHAVGMSDYDLKVPAVEHADVFRAQDVEVFGTQQTMYLFEVLTYVNNEIKYLVSEKRYIFDSDESEPYLFHTNHEIEPSYAVKIALSNIDHIRKNSAINMSFRLVDTIEELTAIESDILFFLMRGMTAKEIGHALGRSFRTVEDHIARIRDKLGCQHKKDIINYCFIKNYTQLMPRSLLASSRVLTS